MAATRFRFSLFLKGIAMGAADVVPGVSGGTIAFITGIYQELIDTLHGLNFSILKTLKKEGFTHTWRQYNLGFLATLFLGVGLSVITLARGIHWLLEEYPHLLWAFFFGLIVASIVYIAKQIPKWRLQTYAALLLGAAVAYSITLLNPTQDADGYLFLFFAGFLAIIAMILPGISGAFILLLLGAYNPIIEALSQLTASHTDTASANPFFTAVLKLCTVALGAIIGLKAFSGLLNWLFQNRKQLVLAVLTGFMCGALAKIWPWKTATSFRTNHAGEKVALTEVNVWPNDYPEDPQLLFVIALAFIGFISLFWMEKITSKKQ